MLHARVALLAVHNMVDIMLCTATGLLEGSKFHGRINPLLGPGIPPQDDYDPPSTHQHHKGWHPMHSHLLQKRYTLRTTLA